MTEVGAVFAAAGADEKEAGNVGLCCLVSWSSISPNASLTETCTGVAADGVPEDTNTDADADAEADAGTGACTGPVFTFVDAAAGV